MGTSARAPSTARDGYGDGGPQLSADNERFDATYYARFYENKATRVASQADIQGLGAFVRAYLDYLQLPVRRVLDMGCGLGWWKPVVAQAWPRARYHGVEVSEHLCEQLGWERGSVDSYRGRGQFDLVICQGVLQYLDHPTALRAIENLGRLCRGALYLEALTREDWRDHCDQKRTDGDVFLRPASFYRRAMSRDFVAIGGGLFVQRRAPVTLYELEKLE